MDYNHTRTVIYDAFTMRARVGQMFNTDLKGLLVATTSGDKYEFLGFNFRKLSAKHERFRAKLNEPDNESQLSTHCNYCRAASCNCVVILNALGSILNLL